MTLRIIMLVLLLCMSAFAGQGMGPGPGLPVVVSADYTPSQVQIAFGTSSTAGNYIKVVVYDSGNNRVCASDPIEKSLGNTVSAAISGCGALLPGATYHIAVVGNGYVPLAADPSPTWQMAIASVANGYSSPPATLPAGGDTSLGEIAVRVINSIGSVLIGDANFSDNTDVSNMGYEANTLTWFAGGYVCATL